jgi:hypothetical protein
MVLAVVFLNLAGGDYVEDIERPRADSGFTAILGAIERDLRSRAERRSLKPRWRRTRERTVPCLRRCRAGWSGSTIRRRRKPSRAARSFRRRRNRGKARGA